MMEMTTMDDGDRGLWDVVLGDEGIVPEFAEEYASGEAAIRAGLWHLLEGDTPYHWRYWIGGQLAAIPVWEDEDGDRLFGERLGYWDEASGEWQFETDPKGRQPMIMVIDVDLIKSVLAEHGIIVDAETEAYLNSPVEED
jgi:hypothetical protein